MTIETHPDLVAMPGPAETPAGLLLLREEVPAALVGKLPKVTCFECNKKENKGECQRHRKTKCLTCGAYISPDHIHLDYVGHAETTSRLLDADVAWNWEPAAWGPDGLPQFDQTGGLWIRLTVCGVTRLGYGTADNAAGFKSPGNIKKEIIGDAIRNAAMRFGHALNLWAKTDIHALTEGSDDEPQRATDGRDEAVRRPAQKRASRKATPEPEDRPMNRRHPDGARSHQQAPDEDPWANEPPKEPASTEKQQRDIAMLLQSKRGITDRDDKLAWLKGRLKRPIGSTKELSYSEAEGAAGFLEKEADHMPWSEEQTANLVREVSGRILGAATVPELNSVGRSINAYLQSGRIVGADRRELIDAWGDRNKQLGAELPKDDDEQDEAA